MRAGPDRRFGSHNLPFDARSVLPVESNADVMDTFGLAWSTEPMRG